MEKDQIIGRFVPARDKTRPDRRTRQVERSHGLRDRSTTGDGQQSPVSGDVPQIPIVELGRTGFVGVKGGLSQLLPPPRRQGS